MTSRLRHRRVAVVGGGLGGLAVAVRLAARGARVSIYEANQTLGGKMNRWTAGGFQFDTGPSLVTMPSIFAETFAAAGMRLEDEVELVRVDPLAHYHFADGTRLVSSTSLPDWISEIRRIEPQDVDGFWRFLRLGAQLFELSEATFFRRPPLAWPDIRTLRAARQLPFRYAWGRYCRTVAAHFRSPHLRQLYNRYPTYVGSSPYRAPATLAVIPFIEQVFGGWYVAGGLYRIVDRLVRRADALGVELHVGSPVVRIECDGRRVRGVQLHDGRRAPADAVVLNTDASAASALLGGRARPLAECDRSLSAVVLLLGTKHRVPSLAHHGIYFSADYAREFDDLFVRRQFPDDPTVYVNVPSRSDRCVVPGDGEALFVMANAPAGSSSWDAEALAVAERRMLTRLWRSGVADFSADVVARDVWTPARFESAYGAPGGAIYGTHSHGWRRAFMRPPNQHRSIRGLYFVGGSTHPGGGTPTVLLSARLVTDLMEAHA